ncbi:hypothetical protein DN069_02255 [Streptacidiphilus pinicola]|uniref:Uncharacterized protein n=1 Tax=Streptacidiphilus pinicola TaxID=2219663 RepID=A0A2X0KL16_9ACTN|nr:hypothetical protein DN069_02255 [Streptacidiphilus pinicola]
MDPLLWLLWPAPIRRAVRAARTAEALYRPKPFRRRYVRFVPDPVPGGIADFDADLGASGRPRPTLHKPAGARSAGKCTAPSRARQRHKGPYLHWDGETLVAGDARGRVRVVPLADDDHPDGVAELVWLTPQDRLLHLDRDGYLLARSPLGLHAQPGNLAQLAAAAGLTFNVYALSHWAETRTEQAALLFPRRWPRLRRLRKRLVRR